MSLLPYLLKVVFCSAFLYAFYYLLLRNKYHHQYNRFYLLLLPVVSFLIPLFYLPFGKTEVKESPVLHTLTRVNVSGWEKEFIVYASAPAYDFTEIAWTVVYVLGLAFFIIPLIASVARIRKIARKSSREVVGNVNILYTDAPGTPFSFFNAVFWNINMPLSDHESHQMMQHELYHVRQKHSLDMLYVETLRAICWINPVFHLLRREIEVIHEFLADEYASKNSSSTDYAELLVRTAISNKQYQLTNSFINSLLKRRIAMITKAKTKKFGYVSRLAVLPVLVFLLSAYGQQSDANTVKEFTVNSDTIPSSALSTDTISQSDFRKEDITTVVGYSGGDAAEPAENATAARPLAKPAQPVEGEILKETEIPASYPGGSLAWKRYLNKTIRYPLQARQKNVQGFVVVRFVVDKQGNLSNVEAINGPLEGGLREEAVNVVQNSGRWEPGVQNGLKVNSYKMQPVSFILNSGN